MMEEAKNKNKDKEVSISGKIREVIDEEGSTAFRFIGSQRTLSKKMKAIIKHLLSTD